MDVIHPFGLNEWMHGPIHGLNSFIFNESLGDYY
jgi:hypothetical protein